MKSAKYKYTDTNKIDLGTKIIYKYPTPTKDMDIAKMVVDGRHPEDKDTYIIEHDCSFVMYILEGNGKIFLDDEIFEVSAGDVVFVPKETRFAVEGKFEYITVDTPAFFPEQSEEVVVE